MKTRWKLTPNDVQKILILYQNGASKSSIAKEFKVDHSTIFYHIVKNTSVINVGQIGFRDPIRCKNIYVHTDFNGEVINKGKSYKQYLAIEKQRTEERQKNCVHTQPYNYHCRNCGKQITFPVKLNLSTRPINIDIESTII